MIEWFKRLFHHHQWVVIKEGKYTIEGKVAGNWYDCRCSVCGKIKGIET